jgi:hypothetical protein
MQRLRSLWSRFCKLFNTKPAETAGREKEKKKGNTPQGVETQGIFENLIPLRIYWKNNYVYYKFFFITVAKIHR